MQLFFDSYNFFNVFILSTLMVVQLRNHTVFFVAACYFRLFYLILQAVTKKSKI